MWLAAPPTDNSLPDTIALWGNERDEEEAKHVLSVLEAVEWKWTPLDVILQPEVLLHNVLVIGGLSSKIRQIEREQEAKHSQNG